MPKKKITKNTLLNTVAQDTGYSRYVVDKIVKSVFDNIIFEVSHGNQVNIQGFGSFSQQERAARTGRNPHTNQAVPIAPRLIPKFTPGDQFKRFAVKELKKK